MQFRGDVLSSFCFDSRAELLGAVFGDGTVESRGHKGFRVSVGVSTKWPLWFERVPQLFHDVFGRYSQRVKSGGVFEYHEFYVTTHDLKAVFGISGKYDQAGSIRPPDWLLTSELYLRLFLRGLVETDGCFSSASDGFDFVFAQKDTFLTQWAARELSNLGFPCYVHHAKAAGVNQLRMGRSEDVARLGEWLQSEKWAAIREEFEGKPRVVDRKRAVAAVAREAVVHKTIDLGEQAKWREWRALGASIVAIARHVGRANSVVHAAVCDIIPERTRTAEELGLKPAPRYPRNPSRDVVEQWRAAALRGMTDVEIAKQWSVPPGKVSDAVADIRWDQRAEERARVQVEREKILSVLQKSS